jgi:hypothetical protein
MKTTTCACKKCQTTATRLGLSAPLTATVDTAQGKNLPAHEVVFAAFDGGAMGPVMRTRYGIAPVGYTHASAAQVRRNAAALVADVRRRNGN